MQIPTVSRMDVQEPASVGRMDVTLPNNREGQIRSQTVNDVANAAYKIIDEREELSAKNAATDAKYQYLNTLSNDLDGLQNLEGDPTEPYSKFQTETQPKYRQDLLNKYKDASGRTQRYVEEQLKDVDRLFTGKRQSAFNNQLDNYRAKQTAAQIDLRKQLALEDLGGVSADKPESFAPLVEGIYEIEMLHINNGIFRGSVKQSTNEKGEQFYEKDFVTTQKIKKDVSDTLFDTVQVLRSSGRIREADKVLADFGDRIDPAQMKKLNDTREKVISDQSATLLFGQVMDMGSTQEALAYIKQQTAEGVQKGDVAAIETRRKATQMFNAHKRDQDQAIQRESKEAMSDLWDIFRAGKFTDQTTFEADPAVSQIIGYMRPQDYKSIKGWFQAPTESDPEAVNTLWEHAQNGTLGALRPSDYQALLLDVNNTDRARFNRIYERATVQSDPQKKEQFEFMAKNLEAVLKEGRKPYIKTEFGKVTPREMVKLNDARQKLADELVNMPAMGTKERLDFVNNLADSIRTGDAFKPPQVQRFRGTLPSRQAPPARTPQPVPAAPAMETTPGATESTPLNAAVNPTMPGFMGTNKSKMEWRRLYQQDLKQKGELKAGEWPDTESDQGRRNFEVFIKKYK